MSTTYTDTDAPPNTTSAGGPTRPSEVPSTRPIPPARAVRLVARREVRTRLLSKPFVVGLLTTVLVIFGAFGLGSLIGNDDPVRIGLVGDHPAGVEDRLAEFARLSDTEVTIDAYADRDAAVAAIDADDIDAAVVDGRQLLMTEADDDVVALLTPAWQQAGLVQAMAEEGLDPTGIDAALDAAAPLTVEELDPDPDGDARSAVAFASVVLLFLAIQIAGAYIMMGVFEEKSSKVVELVLSSIRARDLLAGKVIGVGVLGLVQVVALAGSAVGAAAVFGSNVLPTLSPTLLATSTVWFLLGYLLYGSVFAAGASLAPRQEDAQSTLGPISVLLMVSYFGAIFAATRPDSTLASAISWIPFTSPFAMPGRLAAGDSAWWEVLGSMAITAATAGVVLLLAERIYVRSVIHTDRQLGWREAWRLRA